MVKFYKEGSPDKKVIVLIHAWGCPWEIWKPFMSDLGKDYHVIVPSLEGYNNDGAYGKGIEFDAREILNYMKRNFDTIHAIIGVSYGANVVLKLLSFQEIPISHAIADACYLSDGKNQKQAILMRRIAGLYRFAKPFRKILVNSSAKQWGLEKSIMLIDNILSLPNKTLKEGMYSYFSFVLSEPVIRHSADLHLWYGEKEKDKIKNSTYVKSKFPSASTQIFSNCNHGDLFLKYPKVFLSEIYKIIGK